VILRPGGGLGGLAGPGGSGPTEAGGLVCSAKGSRAHATWALRWNNPKLHDPERRKTWLACGEHKESLSQFLGVRGFLREVEPAPEQDAPGDATR
jgi:hypothetical protein